MNRDITEHEAKQILAGVRRKITKRCAVIRTSVGYKIKPVHSCSNNELSSNGFIGVYTNKASHIDIMNDWNETI